MNNLQNASDTPFIEVAKIDDHTINDEVAFAHLTGWFFSRRQSKTKHEIELPNYDFFIAFTRLL